MPRWTVPVAWAGTSVLALAVGFWAAQATMPPREVATPATPVLYAVTEGTLSRALTFTAQAQWHAMPAARNAANGVVTSLDIMAGDDIKAGQRLFSVDLQPVTAAEGDIPAFRDLALGVHGADVAQVQRFLASMGFLSGRASGDFDQATQAAVRAWQTSVLSEGTGIVRQGDFIYFPRLPAKVAPAESLVVGTPLSGGEPVIQALEASPTFIISLALEQADLVPLDAEVAVHHGGAAWRGVITTAVSTSNGELVLSLASPEGGALCGHECDVVPVGMTTLFTTDVIVVPATTGAMVPVSALTTTPGGAVTLMTDAGEVKTVTVVTAAEGRAIVTGIPVGTVVRLFGGTPDETSGAASGDPAGPS